jgi:signal transduction histidine kinase
MGQGRPLQKDDGNEAELEGLTTERVLGLIKANAEMEAFCYSVTHDLREPLRAVSATSKILLEEAADHLKPEEIQYLRRQVAAVNGMSVLIDDLLLLFKLGRVDFRAQEVSVSEIACSVREDLLSRQWEADPEIVVQPDVWCNADPGLLRICLLNLMENACKYSAGRPWIEVGLDQTGVIFVRDRGEGFDMKYAEMIFEPFQRLEKDSATPGSGIGLAIVKRIVERHGGKVWATSVPGIGTTFYLKLAGRARVGEGPSRYRSAA